MGKKYKVKDTGIEYGGVLRCCLGTIAGSLGQDTEVELGTQDTCKYCGRVFTLVAPEDALRTCYRNPKFPIWTPRPRQESAEQESNV
jgi:hypothetical protein